MQEMRFLPARWLALCSLLSLVSPICAQDVSQPVEHENFNNYQQVLSEPLIDEGTAALANNNYRSAERLFSEAQQIIKINHGLHSDLQIPALQLLIQSLIPQGRWSIVAQQLSYFEWINSSNYSTDIDSYLQGTAILSQLYLMAAASPYNAVSARFLIAAKNLNWRAVSSIEANFGRLSPQLPEWLYKVVVAHFYQSSLTARRGMTSYDYKTDSDELVSGWSLSKNESLRKSYGIGLELLERIRHIYSSVETAPAEVDAMMLVYLGDWELLFGNGDSALRYYQQANTEFLTAGVSQERINGFFDEAMILPATELMIKLGDDASAEDDAALSFTAWSPKFPGAAVPYSKLWNTESTSREVRVSATFNLLPRTPGGRSSPNESNNLGFAISDLEIDSIVPDSEPARQQARRDISALRLRPRIKDGNVVARQAVQLDYYFAPELQEIVLQ